MDKGGKEDSPRRIVSGELRSGSCGMVTVNVNRVGLFPAFLFFSTQMRGRRQIGIPGSGGGPGERNPLCLTADSTSPLVLMPEIESCSDCVEKVVGADGG